MMNDIFMQILQWFALFFILGLALIVLFIWLSTWWRNRTDKNINLNIFLVKIPRFVDNDNKDTKDPEFIKHSLGKIEHLFSALAGLKADKGMRRPKNIFSFEIVAHRNQIMFYVALPKKFTDFFIEQMQAVYPKVFFESVVDYNIFEPFGQIVGGILTLKNDYSLPLKTYTTFESDPLESITNTLSKLRENEGAVVQYVMKSAPSSWHARGRKIAANMHAGMTFREALSKVGGGQGSWSALGKIFSFIFSFFQGQKSNPAEKDRQPLSAMEQERAKELEEKSSKPGLDCNIRIVVSAPTLERSQQIAADIVNSYSQYNIYEFGNSFHAQFPRAFSDLLDHFIYRCWTPKHNLLLNSEEIVSLIHLPLLTTATPNIVWLEAIQAPPPHNLPIEGLVLGKNIYRGKETLVKIKEADRQRHMYVIGQTGVGKTELMKSLAVQDIQNGHGVCVVDPHGDFVDEILANVPKERAGDVILFDPSDIERPIGMNMLEFENDEQKTFMINEMIAIFDKLYDLRATGGPMFEQYMRNAMLLIMDDKDSGATLLEVPRVLADEQYRRFKLSKVQNRFVKDFWEKEAQKAGGEASLANMVPYITSKLTPFIYNDTIRPIIAQQKSALNFRQAMDEQKIILLNLSKGKIGAMNSNLLGMIVIGKILYAALSRADTASDDRKNFYLYIDEFQNFITESISVILSEARKYKLNLILAHQFIAQLTKNNDTAIRDAIFGNVGTIVAFRIGVEDAELIAKQMAPVVSEYDLINMPKYTCYLKLLLDNANPPAFNFNPIRPPKGNYELAQAIRELSRLKYGRDRKIIEEEISRRVVI